MKKNKKIKSDLAVIYARSTRGSEDDIADQLAMCIEFCDHVGLTPAHVFMAGGSSTTTECKRSVRETIEFCLDEKNDIAALVVPSIDRITRNTNEFVGIRNRLKARGISLIGRIV